MPILDKYSNPYTLRIFIIFCQSEILRRFNFLQKRLFTFRLPFNKISLDTRRKKKRIE